MARLTFPDQQQDLQNAANASLAIECDGSVKFARLVTEADSTAFRLLGGVRVGSGVSEVREAFCTSKVGMRQTLRPDVGGSRVSCPAAGSQSPLVIARGILLFD